MADLINVKGLSELQAFLDQLPAKMERNVMRSALRAGMNVVKDEAKSTSEFADKTGVLRRGLKVSTKAKGGKVTASLKATGKHGFLARFIEYGTSAHMISAKDGGALAFAGGMYQSVLHPGQKAQPFMRPALDLQTGNAILATAEYIKERLATKNGLDTSEVDIGLV